MVESDADFYRKLLASFEAEAQEHLQALSKNLLSLEQAKDRGQNRELIETIFRSAHSLKGAARAVDLKDIEAVCQDLEDVLARWRSGELAIEDSQFDALYGTLDQIRQLISPSSSEENVDLAVVDKLEMFKEPPLPEKRAAEQAPVPKTHHHDHAQTNTDRTIRVGSEKIDRLLQHVEEMLIVKLSARQRTRGFRHIQDLLNQQMKLYYAAAGDMRGLVESLEKEGGGKNKHLIRYLHSRGEFFKVISSEVNRFIKDSEQEGRMMTSLVDMALEETKRVLMQPFFTITEGLPRVVRDLCRTLKREVAFEVSGGEIEIDRRILEQIKDPLLHLIRNALDHGIETPEERVAAKKLPKGKLTISASQTSGSRVEIIVSDDGRGIDLPRVREAALKKGYMNESELDALSPQELIQLIFRCGFSTSQIVTEISGRGVGMGIVYENVEKMGGQVRAYSEPGLGTQFCLELPLTLATFRGIHAAVEGREFIFPTQSVVRVMRVRAEEIKRVENRETFVWEGRPISYADLADVLGIERHDHEDLPFRFVLVVKTAESVAAFGVDKVLNEQEVFVKGLGSHLLRLRNISAATITDSGKVVPVLDPFDLVRSLNGERGAALTRKEKIKKKKQRVLVVDDSMTSRILLKNILESAGYEVKSAVDGEEAFALLGSNEIDLLLSDVEMPRLGGFELTEKVRASDKWGDLPVVLCTSRGSKEDREKGIEVGANAYLDKSSFQQNHLIDVIQRLL